MRAFIAVELPPDLQADLRALQHAIAAHMEPRLAHNVRWTPAENVHLTLRFLGECAPAQHLAIVDELRILATTIQPFDLVLRGIGCFPNFRRPAIIWLGVAGEAAHGQSAALQQLQRATETIALNAGFAAESRAYSPHLTLARLERHAVANAVSSIGDSVRAAATAPEIGGWQRTVHVGHIAFMQSELRPQGARYTALDKVLLGASALG